MSTQRFGVVGAGIVGLAVARQLALLRPDATVTVLEKESRIAAHQTGHNSGVAHAGLYYAPGSLKARLCRAGIVMLEEFCAEQGLEFRKCGKLVVAKDEAELPGLAEIERRARANGVPGIRWLSSGALREVEPHVRGVAAVHSPETAIVDFTAVARALAAELRRLGGELRLNFEVVGFRPQSRGIRVVGASGEQIAFDRLVLCPGLQADRLARMAGDSRPPMIVPFRGEYHRLAPRRADLVRGLVYPVPDPRYPFLGVHFTRRVDGSVDVGPNAVLALAREGYRRSQVRADDLWDMVSWAGFRRMAYRNWRSGLKEYTGSLSRRAYLAEARAYVPELTLEDLRPAPAGVRAQAVDPDGSLVDDFRIGRVGPVTTIRNAPSPAATSSLAIADHIARTVLDDDPS